MKRSLFNFQTNLKDITVLLDLASKIDGSKQRPIFRSSVVLLIALWEQYIEQLAELSVTVLTDRLRDSTPLPENVKQRISLVSVIEKRNNLKKFSESVWMFADKGWKVAYINYCVNLTSNFHTASPKNVSELFMKILGIRDITKSWNFLGLPSSKCVEMLDDLVALRHDIAHGANERNDELEESKIREQTDFITSIAQGTYKIVFNHTADLSFTQALEYSLAPSYFSAIIEYAARKDDRILTLNEIKEIGSSAQGNHNKLCYEPWALLKKVNRNTRHIPDRLIQFAKNEISLPLEILVFDNKEAIAKPKTREVMYSDLKNTN